MTERRPHRSIVAIPFEFSFRDTKVGAQLNGYDLHEMLGTKMRALFQRKRGRDLFDLYWALTHASPPVRAQDVVDSFLHYLDREGGRAGRAEFIAILDSHLADRGFRSDMRPLLRNGVDYDPIEAGVLVKSRLLELIPA